MENYDKYTAEEFEKLINKIISDNSKIDSIYKLSEL